MASLALVTGGPAPRWPAWFEPCTPARVRAEKEAAKRWLDEMLTEIRAAFWPLMRGDLLRSPIEAAEAWNSVEHKPLDTALLEAAFGKRQTQLWREIGYARSDDESLRKIGELTKAALPAGWRPATSDTGAADLVNAVDGARGLEIERLAPIGSSWRTRSGGFGDVEGYTSTAGVYILFAGGRRTDFGLQNFLGPDPWLTRIPSKIDLLACVPVGSRWTYGKSGKTMYVVSKHERCSYDRSRWSIHFRPPRVKPKKHGWWLQSADAEDFIGPKAEYRACRRGISRNREAKERGQAAAPSLRAGAAAMSRAADCGLFAEPWHGAVTERRETTEQTAATTGMKT